MSLKLKDHPQVDQYNDASEWPWLAEGQGWWKDKDPRLAGHLHIAIQFPSYAILTPEWMTFRVNFVLKVHNIPGYVSDLVGLKDIIWDATGTSTPPTMRGLEMGLVQWTGSGLVDFTPVAQPWFGSPDGDPLVHGPAFPSWTARVRVDNGDVLTVQISDCCFIAFDTTQPERPAPQQGTPGVRHMCIATVINVASDAQAPGTTLSGTSWGEMHTEIRTRLPLKPYVGQWPLNVYVYNYTAGTNLQTGHFMQMLDANLHGTPATPTTPAVPPNLGILLDDDRTPSTKGFDNRMMLLDTKVAGPGNHRVLVVWEQSAQGNGQDETFRSVVAINMPVGTGAPVPLICEDKAALNTGQLLPCVYPGLSQPPPIIVPPLQVAVPNVVGMTVTAAHAALAAAGLTVGSLSTKNDPSPVGSVLTQTPAAGALVDRGSAVALVTSLGSLQEWKENVAVTFMQLYVDGQPTNRFQLCDTTGKHICVELVTTPGVDTMEGM